MPSLSVIICTYNPVEAVFVRCLSAIEKAALQKAPAEIIIIDNNSSKAIQEEPYISTFLQQNKNARIVAEAKPGLTHARLKGISEAMGDILIFIDDDNVIATDFFLQAEQVALENPHIGSYSGQVTLSVETAPPAWTRRYWGMLVYREFRGNHWSNIPFNQETMPCGAGLCVTKEVARYYFALHENGKRNFYLDREKDILLSGGDNDLAMCACDIGKGMGLFEKLRLEHIMREDRFSLKYLARLAHGIYYSEVLLRYMRTGKIEQKSYLRKIRSYVRTWIMRHNDGVINRACLKGTAEASRKLVK